jgi:hypothetical protein
MLLPGRKRRRSVTYGGQMMLLAAMALLMEYFPADMQNKPRLTQSYANVLWLFLIGGWIWWVLLRNPVARLVGWRRHPAGRRWKAIVLTAMTVGIVGTPIYFQNCPHGEYVWVGPFGLVYSDRFGPCRELAPSGKTHLGGKWYFVCEMKPLFDFSLD